MVYTAIPLETLDCMQQALDPSPCTPGGRYEATCLGHSQSTVGISLFSYAATEAPVSCCPCERGKG